ncbi:hypothetical protein [Metapseudomonas otitidis]|uniref:hypothetical protein n=1 Tax=Metapseudomonas otitidis TaxID=319939 RepID=UPI001F2387CD|nr:hypothetical protein [Pseudomonas otitidis]
MDINGVFDAIKAPLKTTGVVIAALKTRSGCSFTTRNLSFFACFCLALAASPAFSEPPPQDEASEVLTDDVQDDELPPFHRPLSASGFTRLSAEEAAAITKQLPVVDPDYNGRDGEAEPVCLIKRLDRDRKLSPYLELYRKMTYFDPEMVPRLKFRGKLIEKTAKGAEQQNQQLAQLLSPHLPAYILKRSGDKIVAFKVASAEDLHALLNNTMYETYQDFSESDAQGDPEASFINFMLYEDSTFNLQFPSLGGHLHLSADQVFIGATSEESLQKLEALLKPVGAFKYRADEPDEEDEYEGEDDNQ